MSIFLHHDIYLSRFCRHLFIFRLAQTREVSPFRWRLFPATKDALFRNDFRRVRTTCCIRVEWGKRPTLRKMCYNLQQRYRKKQLLYFAVCMHEVILYQKNVIRNLAQFQARQKSRFVFPFKKGVLPRRWGKTPMGGRFASLFTYLFMSL